MSQSHHPTSPALSRGIHYGWIVLALGTLTVFAALGLARFGYTMILPPMRAGLELSNTEAGALATGNFIGYLALALIGGALASRFSPRRVIAVSVFVVGIAMILTATAGGFVEALLWRVVTGMGSGGGNVPAMALMAAWFAKERRGLATGIAVAGSSVSLIVTGPLVPWILNRAGESGWRVSWVVLGAAACGIGILGWFFLRNTPAELGLEPIGGTMRNADCGMRNETAGNAGRAGEIETRGSEGDGGKGKSAAGGVAGWREVYGSGVVLHLAAIYFTFGFSYIIFATFFAQYLQEEAGYTKEAAGRYWQAVGWLSLTCGVIWGWVSDVLGRKYGLACVCFLQATCYAAFALWTGPGGVMAATILFGLTAWSIPAIMAAACGDHLGARLAPAALGFLTLFMGIGQALGPFAAGVIADKTGSFSPAFLAAAVVALVGGAGALLLKRHH